MKPLSDDSEKLLAQEFDYAKQTSLESQRDRLTILQFYVSLFSGISGLIFAFSGSFDIFFSSYIPFVFLLLALLSILFGIQIARLRQQWIESVKVMNKIKSYYIEKDEGLKQFILWSAFSIPKAENTKSISFFSINILSILGAISIFIFGSLSGYNAVLIVIVSLIFWLVANLISYLILKFNW